MIVFRVVVCWLLFFSLLSGCSLIKKEQLPSTNKELARLAGKHSYVKDERGHYVSETYENNSAAHELCLRLNNRYEISQYCAPFIYGAYAEQSEYKVARDKYREKISPPDPDARLQIAAWLGDEALVKKALSEGGNPNSIVSMASIGFKMPGNISPLNSAYVDKNPSLIKLLLASGADVNSAVVDLGKFPEGLSYRAADNSESLDIMLRNGYDISYAEVKFYNDYISGSCNLSPGDRWCGMSEIFIKYSNSAMHWHAAEMNRAKEKIKSIEASAKSFFEGAGLHYIPLDKQSGIDRKKGMKVCLSDGNFAAIGNIDDVAGDKVKILISGFFPQHIQSMNIDQAVVYPGDVIWSSKSDWLVCEKVNN